MATRKQLAAVRRDPTKLLAVLGRVAANYYRSGFGDRQGVVRPWSPRYAGHDEPHVNIAGLVADLNKGGQPKARRFVPRPAGSDTGALARSIASRVEGDTAVVGSTLPYAQTFHAGGESQQFIDQSPGSTFRRGLSKFLRSKGKKDHAGIWRAKLGFLFATPILVTNVHPRPIVGWTDELARDLTETVHGWLDGDNAMGNQAKRYAAGAPEAANRLKASDSELGAIFGIDLGGGD